MTSLKYPLFLLQCQIKYSQWLRDISEHDTDRNFRFNYKNQYSQSEVKTSTANCLIFPCA